MAGVGDGGIVGIGGPAGSGVAVGAAVASGVTSAVGSAVGSAVASAVGSAVGSAVASAVGSAVGAGAIRAKTASTFTFRLRTARPKTSSICAQRCVGATACNNITCLESTESSHSSRSLPTSSPVR
ncbi:MAG: hypothetical protein CUN51_07805 [Candidatus Thermofonsia Clade 1 bacterium]|uniref:Uncharacterized protein n=1 Tax=Candidatus Thermofonsia Clade 1 bacterium TaxID=2364210 RepID=A0A2M8NYP6_9CHLR|nr:MAG: hypothetical protein CUN51_07805 [Candidatus Thermofonsia Clade 1 bacterium]